MKETSSQPIQHLNEAISQPAQHPKQAALQLVIELVRAGKLSPLQGDAANMISIYEQFKTHFEQERDR
ncbi:MULTISPECIES: hypothetical protein [Tatumella]|uniref:Uncharacterized protein n=1 Tax=Tatumella punctata TaxID=399969 RepID=A0ABW1VP35_9GAMM|nr:MULTISPECIES: hypothetical protein [unclassified Tatumella]MBS0856826.1 hypothetical protein [Tatumella sp. JGM16]MBS0878785.1 hypothetical protein [Tatumella sp. JGM82]MBS0890114.1 hypothetical protein [Tatumella sp. JGM94]MBS0893694.1 hypothetical protein [Tatumella sp. JGM130]MBS0901949.1 hypothetical protein [Tatumella sp. JGM100]